MGRSAFEHRRGYLIFMLFALAFLPIPALHFHEIFYQVPDFKTVYSSV